MKKQQISTVHSACIFQNCQDQEIQRNAEEISQNERTLDKNERNMINKCRDGFGLDPGLAIKGNKYKGDYCKN